MRLQIQKAEDSPVVNFYVTLKHFKGNTLKKKFHRCFPQAHYSKAPFGYSEVASGMWIDAKTGIGMLVRYDGGHEMF